MAGCNSSVQSGTEPRKSVPGKQAEAARQTPAAAFEMLAGQFGFSFYLFATFPHGDKSDFAGNHILSNWPDALRIRYAALDLFRTSDLVAQLKMSILPVFSPCCVFSKGEANQNANGLSACFAEHGLRDTLSFSLHDTELRHYVFAFSGDRGPLTEQERMEIFFRSMELLDDYTRRIRADDGPLERLSGREIECLRWSAAGKSSEEIAIILNISSHTVASYLKGAMRKLDSVNRMQAIARACRYRLL